MPRLRVLIAAFDGLQPSQVTPEATPVVHALAARGVTFARHRGVFPTVTRVNAASMVTGRYPGGHGLLGNTLVFPELDRASPVAALEPELSRVAAVTDGRVLLAPTLGELLASTGRSFATVVGGTSGNAYVQHPRATQVGGGVFHPEFALPGRLYPEMLARVGPWPPKDPPALGRIRHVAETFLRCLVPLVDPEVGLVWFPEPDTSQHASGVGSPPARAALTTADAELGRILETLARTGVEPDVLVVSDHGYSTIARGIDVEREVRAAGFAPGGQKGGVAVAPNGGAVLFYVHDGAADVVARLATWLAGQPWAGALIGGSETAVRLGLLPGALAGVTGPRGADIVMSCRWDSADGANGFPGRCDAVDGAQPGQGTHGSGSPQELRCTLVAAGPSFREGLVSEVPSGNVDLTPTVLRLLDVRPSAAFDGRPLVEALRAGNSGSIPVPPVTRRTVERPGGGGHQRLVIEEVGGTRYLMELGRDLPP